MRSEAPVPTRSHGDLAGTVVISNPKTGRARAVGTRVLVFWPSRIAIGIIPPSIIPSMCCSFVYNTIYDYI